jgi:hypothetical protein
MSDDPLVERISRSLWEMANVDPRDSGLPMRLFFSWGEYSGVKLPNGTRFTIETAPGQFASVDLNNLQCPSNLHAKDWHKVVTFIDLNREVIMKFRDEKLTDPEFHRALTPLSK